jgi:four helix bundle protein
MNRIERFEDLQAWQAARELTRAIYEVSRNGPLAKDYSLRDQLLRVSVGIMADVAQGFERFERADKLGHWGDARGGCCQVRALTYLCEDSRILEGEVLKTIRELCDRTGKLLFGLCRATANLGARDSDRGTSPPPSPNRPAPSDRTR